MVQRHPASFKDPSGFVFSAQGIIYRQVHQQYAEHYDRLMQSGLYAELVDSGRLVPHTETENYRNEFPGTYKILQPEPVPFISYPSEWCFSQLQQAALCTLQIMQAAVAKNMVLKDATPYNIQFLNGNPVLIDTLSFETYIETDPWVAYRQFCETFLYPLLLAHYRALEIREIFGAWPDGVPAPVVSGLLPGRTRFNMGVALHVHLPASAYAKQKSNTQKKVVFSRTKMNQLLQHLQAVVKRLNKGKRPSVWASYYEETILSREYLEAKKKVCEQLFSQIPITTVFDAGANDGAFTKLLQPKAKYIVAADYDAECVERLYHYTREQHITNVLPLVADMANPYAASGVLNTERGALLQRCTTGLVLALALIHHLCIGRFMSFTQLAEMFSGMGEYLLVEFVPLTDEKAQQLLAGRTGTFAHYTEEAFVAAFEQRFTIHGKSPVAGSERVIYLAQRKPL